ncbi:MAG: RNA polymerase sigma factor [Bacteroidota bacterium]
MKNPSCNTAYFYQTHRDKLLGLILRRVACPATAQDILHDTFERFEKCAQNGGQCTYPKSYLYRVALNLVADHYRKRKVDWIPIDDQHEGTFMVDEPSFFHSFNIYACVLHFLPQLSPENQKAFVMADLEKIPQTEIAQSLNLPLSTLKARVQRARRYLKRELEQCLAHCEEKM